MLDTLNSIINALPQPWNAIIVFILTVIGSASMLAAYLPQPTATSGFWFWIRKVIDFLGHNFLNAKNTPPKN